MEDLKKLKSRTKYIKLVGIVSIIICTIFVDIRITFCFWHEEPIIEETKKRSDYWWLSKKKQEEAREKERIANEESLKNSEKIIKWIYDESDYNKFPVNKWEIIDENGDGVGYRYYFGIKGDLLKDTITPDYRIVDKYGREIDSNCKAIQYNMEKYASETDDGIVLDKEDPYITLTKEPAKVIIGEGVVIKEKKKIYDNLMDKNVLNYIETSNRFIKSTKGTINNKVKWRECSSIKNKGYIIIKNPNNNFNKITTWISNEYVTANDSYFATICVYDADEYDKFNKWHILYDLEPIYTYSDFNNKGADRMIFTFDRSIKRLRIELLSDDNEKETRNTYIKDIKFGFSKSAFEKELEDKKEKEEEIEELKRLGIYVEDYYSLVALDEEGNEIEDDEEDEEDVETDDSLYDENGGYIHRSDAEETISYEDVIRDRNTGPAFDDSLKEEHTWRDSGPAFNSKSGNE